MRRAIFFLGSLPVLLGLWFGPADAVAAAKKGGPKPSPAVETAQRYVAALAAGDTVAAGQLDFACVFRLAASGPTPAFPPDTDPLYRACWEPVAKAHDAAIQHDDLGVNALWPGKGRLVFFKEDLVRYAPSAFVMDALGASPPAGGFLVEPLDSAALPPASFRLRENGPLASAPATLVRLRIRYKDPLLSPVAYAPGAVKWANTITRPRAAIKSVIVKWTVLSGLKKLGFPADTAVLNLPVRAATARGPATPFVTEQSGYDRDSASWWQPDDMPGLLIAAVARAALFPDLPDRLGMLNRVLMIDPAQADGLTLLTRDLYGALLQAAAAAHGMAIDEPALAASFNEIYWNTYAQTTRTALSLGMEMGGLAQPAPADYLYRVIPAMERLATIHPRSLENRLRLGIAYRWNMDQLAAIATHEAMLNEVPAGRPAARARILIELAWSRIAKVAWNRTFNDTGILQAQREAEEAFRLTDLPVDTFVASYTTAYGLLFMPQRDNQKLLERLREAKTLYLALPGSSKASWNFLLSPELLKAVLDADPIFKPLLEG